MVQSELWDVDVARRYDTPGTGMFAPDVLGPCVDRLTALAGGGAALERSGRAAWPCRSRSVV
jgi:hypothetical protein